MFRLANVHGRAALVDANGYLHDVECISDGRVASEPLGAVASPNRLHELTEALEHRLPIGSIKSCALGAPVPRPGKLVAVSWSEASAELNASHGPGRMHRFEMWLPSVCGPYSDIPLPCQGARYEATVVVAISRRAWKVPAQQAWSFVAGLTVGQHLYPAAPDPAGSAGEVDMPTSSGRICPIGPMLVSPDGFTEPSSVSIECFVNGELRAKASMGALFDCIPSVVAHVTSHVPLEPGDLIVTASTAEEKMLRPSVQAGDVLQTVLTGVGSMANRCVGVGVWQ